MRWVLSSPRKQAGKHIFPRFQSSLETEVSEAGKAQTDENGARAAAGPRWQGGSVTAGSPQRTQHGWEYPSLGLSLLQTQIQPCRRAKGLALVLLTLGPTNAILEKEMANHSSTLAWRIRLQRVGHNWETNTHKTSVHRTLSLYDQYFMLYYSGQPFLSIAQS